MELPRRAKNPTCPICRSPAWFKEYRNEKRLVDVFGKDQLMTVKVKVHQCNNGHPEIVELC